MSYIDDTTKTVSLATPPTANQSDRTETRTYWGSARSLSISHQTYAVELDTVGSQQKEGTQIISDGKESATDLVSDA